MCDAVKHGTTYAYQRYRCRCPAAVELMREYWRFKRQPIPAVDEVAVERAMRGDKVNLTEEERGIVVETLTERGMSSAEIAQRLGVTQRSVVRYRKALREAV